MLMDQTSYPFGMNKTKTQNILREKLIQNKIKVDITESVKLNLKLTDNQPSLNSS